MDISDKTRYESKGSFKEFLKEVLGVCPDTLVQLSDSKSKDFAILFGNGLLLSHPDHGLKFNFCYESIKKDFIKELKRTDLDKFSSLERVTYLNFFITAEMILKKYVEGFEQLDLKSERLRKYMEIFNSVYTLNYDPIIYNNIFPKVHKVNKTSKFADGIFEKGKSAEYIYGYFTEEQKNNKIIPIYFVHGAFHLYSKFCRNKPIYYKVKRTARKSLMVKCKENLEEIFSKFKKSEVFDRNLTLVISYKDVLKKAIILNNPYLEMCYLSLKKVKKVFIFGCSFEFDLHILEALALGDAECVYLGYCEEVIKYDDYKNNIESKIDELINRVKQSFNYSKSDIDKLQEFKNRITFVETSDFADVVWKKD